MKKRTTNRYRRGPQTPLSRVIEFYGVYTAMPRCLTLLLDAGADPDFHYNEGSTFYDSGHFSPLHHALKSSMHYHSSNGTFEHLFERMIRGSHVALMCSTIRGVEKSIWMFGFSQPGTLPLRIVKRLLDMGCDINETAASLPDIPDGWTCLFLQVLRAFYPQDSREFEVTRFLIRQHANIFAKDGSGLTIFDHVNAELTWTSKSYQWDLWYCALRREGIDIGAMIEEHPRIAKYNERYTPEHYRALCCLDHWTEENLSQQVHDLLEAYPWSEEEISELSRIHNEKEAKARRDEEERRRARGWT